MKRHTYVVFILLEYRLSPGKNNWMLIWSKQIIHNVYSMKMCVLIAYRKIQPMIEVIDETDWFPMGEIPQVWLITDNWHSSGISWKLISTYVNEGIRENIRQNFQNLKTNFLTWHIVICSGIIWFNIYSSRKHWIPEYSICSRVWFTLKLSVPLENVFFLWEFYSYHINVNRSAMRIHSLKSYIQYMLQWYVLISWDTCDK